MNFRCAEGYVGPRCEYKDLDGSYLRTYFVIFNILMQNRNLSCLILFSTATRPRVMIETASIASGATLAFILMIILGIVMYVRWHQQQKKDRLEQDISNGVDTVDGLRTIRTEPERRPFGPHHYHTIAMSESFKK